MGHGSIYIHTYILNPASHKLQSIRKNPKEWIINLSPFDNNTQNNELILDFIDLQDNSYFSLLSMDDWEILLSEEISINHYFPSDPSNTDIADIQLMQYHCQLQANKYWMMLWLTKI